MSASGPLAGVRVLDFCSFINGSYGVQLMGDLGAEVIKVEPLSGDQARTWAPFISGESRFFQAWNRNKRGIAIDLSSEAGRKIVHELARRADVLCENMRTGVTGRLGIDYATIRAINPRIIYCTSTGFGSKGPLRERPAYDPVLQSMGGAVHLNGLPRFAGRPSILAVAVSDYQAAMQVFGGVCAALFHRERTGEGQHVETSLLQAIMAMQSHYYVEAMDFPEEGQTGIYPYRLFETSDNVIFIGAGTDKFWRLLCDAIELPELGCDPRYAMNKQRVNAAEEIFKVLAPRFKTRSTAEWLECIEKAGVPCAPVWTMHDFMHHPQVSAMDMNPVIEHSTIGRLRVPGVPIHFEKTPGSIRISPPVLGEHTEEVLKELGYDEQAITSLRESGVILSAVSKKEA